MLDQIPVLIVEDEPIVAMDLAFAVSDSGGEVVGPVGSVDEAFRALSHSQVGAAILDFQLRDHDVTPFAEHLAEGGERRQATVDDDLRSPFGPNDTPNEERVWIVTDELTLRQSRLHQRVRRDIKERFDLCGIATISHDVGVGPTAKCQHQRIDEDRLTRPGLACDDGEPGSKLDVDLVDDGEVSDLEL